MKKLLVLVFILIALMASADKNLTYDEMINTTVLIYKQGGWTLESWIGSGVIISSDGYIVTNRHVAGYYLTKENEGYKLMGGGTPLWIYHKDWGYGGCRVVAVSNDPNRDLALLKIEGVEEFPYAEIATIKNMLPGDTVYSIGHPHGVMWTITKGIITNLLEFTDHNKWIMHDSSMNPGKSGGPLFDEFGRVVGLNFAAVPPDYAENMGLAIDARMIALFVELSIEFDRGRMKVMSEDDFRETSRSNYYKGFWYEY